jgi:fatty acid amide hydrolase
LANDLGGSIRFPSHSCGIVGLKPTTLRLTNAGCRDNLHGMEAIRPQCGPLARRVEDLQLALEVLTTLEPGEIDPQIAPVPLGDPRRIEIDQLRIGMWTDDGFYPASPALRRAVREAADALRAMGAQVEPFNPPEMPHAVELYFRLLSADGAADARRVLGASPRDWRMNRLVRLAGLPAWLRAPVRMGLSAAGQRRTAELLRWIGARSADDYWQLSYARAAYAERFFARWAEARLDALLCPPHALPALRHGGAEHLAIAASYCYLANVLGVPAGVVPVTRVRADEQSDRLAGRDLVDRAAAATDAGSAGLPVGVQIAARPWREDVVLALMAALESRVHGRDDFPRTPIDPIAGP